MGQLSTKIQLMLLAVVCGLGLLYYVCQKWEEYHNDPLTREFDNYETESWTSRGASTGGGGGDSQGETAAVRDGESSVAVGGAQEGEDSGDIGMARTLPLEG